MTPEERVWKEELEADIERAAEKLAEKAYTDFERQVLEGGRGLSGTVQAPIAVPRPGEPPLEGSPNPSTLKVPFHGGHLYFTEDSVYGAAIPLSSDSSGLYGPKCNCHSKRNMERVGKRLYRCQESDITFEFQVDAKSAQGYTMVPCEM